MFPSATPASPQAREAVALQRAAVARLKREIVGVDRNSRRRYIREFHEEFSRFEDLSSWDDLAIACFKADLVYVGDYHALPDSQAFAARLLRDIATRSRHVVLGMEMVYGRDQGILDRFMSGALGEEEFLKAIRYDQEWGYSWESFRRLFQTARELGVAVVGLDCGPRSGFRLIRRRDDYAAARLVDVVERRPSAKIVALVGESHLARQHLPGKVTAALKRRGIEKSPVIVLQNLEEIYWQIAERGLDQFEVVSLGPGRFCHFNTSPIAKYEAYRRTLEAWKDNEDEDQVDLTGTVHGMIDTILKFLAVNPYRFALRRPGGGRDCLIDLYPEVYSGLDEADLRRLLRGHRFASEDVDDLRAHVARNGSCYVPRINAVIIGTFNAVHAGEEAAHFVNLVLKGEIHDESPREMPQHDLFYCGVMEEALGFFGSKLIDPGRNHFFETEFYQYYRKDREAIEANTPYSFEDFNAIIHFVLLHKKFEREYASYDEVPPEILDGVRSEPRRANILIHELGYFLGQQIYDAYRAGILQRREIGALFRRSFRGSGTALRAYLDLVERVRGAHPNTRTGP